VLAEPLLTRDDDEPPPSGVRVRVVVLEHASRPARDDVLVAVTEEVFFEVWSIVRALSPLGGAWFRVGLAPIASGALQASTWSCSTAKPTKLLRDRWHELVPGVAALDRLANLLVDQLCG
jgi:hypothetical protein